MKIGDTEITRDMLPSVQAWQMNPDHIAQGMQDILMNKLGGRLMMPQMQDAGMMGTMQENQNQWNGDQK